MATSQIFCMCECPPPWIKGSGIVNWTGSTCLAGGAHRLSSGPLLLLRPPIRTWGHLRENWSWTMGLWLTEVISYTHALAMQISMLQKKWSPIFLIICLTVYNTTGSCDHFCWCLHPLSGCSIHWSLGWTALSLSMAAWQVGEVLHHMAFYVKQIKKREWPKNNAASVYVGNGDLNHNFEWWELYTHCQWCHKCLDARFTSVFSMPPRWLHA